MRFALAAGGAALAAAMLLAGRPLGIGVLLVAALVVVAVGRAGGLPLALAAAAAVRDATWLVGLDLVAAVVLASLTLAGGRTASQLAKGASAFLWRLPPFARTAAAGASDLRPYVPAARGAILGGVLVVPFGALFLSADAAFAQLVQDAVPSPGNLPGRLLAFAAVALTAVGLLAAARGGAPAPAATPRRVLAGLEGTIPLALLDLLFLAFVLVQLTVLFGGHDHVLETAGLTYAEYAREGFAELLAAVALMLVVVAGARRHVPPSRLRHALLALLCALTLVVLASSVRRLGLYEDAFGFTRLRIGAHAVAFWLGGLVLLVAVGGRRLPRSVVAWTAVALAVFTLANPDAIVARHDVDRWRTSGRIDLAYLRSLSADAVPALAVLPPLLRSRVLAPQRTRLRRGDSWSSWNLGRARARRAIPSPSAARSAA